MASAGMGSLRMDAFGAVQAAQLRRHSSTGSFLWSMPVTKIITRSNFRDSESTYARASRSRRYNEDDENLEDDLPSGSLRVVLALLGVGFAWAVAAVAVLLLCSERYRTEAVNQERGRYVSSVADRVGDRAAVVLSAALAAHDAVRYAVRRRFYFDPLDYNAARSALAPVFAAAPALRAVDLAFTDRNESITLRRLANTNDTGPGLQLLQQSDAGDCFEQLGPTGCMTSLPAPEQPWLQLALGLPLGEDFMTDIFRWVDGPAFVPAEPPGGLGVQSPPTVVWAPAYALVFRTIFPGTRSSLSVLGRATLEVTGLRSDGALQDEERLGPGGSIYLCDTSGVVIAAARPSLQVLIQSPSGRVRFRRAWELQEPWSSSLSAADFAGQSSSRLIGRHYVALVPLSGRGMDHFVAVVAAEAGPFFDGSLGVFGTGSLALAIVPVPVILVILVALYLARLYLQRRHLQKIWASGGTGERPPSDSSDKGTLIRKRTKAAFEVTLSQRAEAFAFR